MTRIRRADAIPQRSASALWPENRTEPEAVAHHSTTTTALPSLFWDIVAALGFMTMIVFALGVVWALFVCIVAAFG